MEAEQVVEKILSEAKAEADKIKKQAQDKEAAEQAKLDEQLADYKSQTDTLAQKAADAEKLHLLDSQLVVVLHDAQEWLPNEVLERHRFFTRLVYSLIKVLSMPKHCVNTPNATLTVVCVLP